MFGRVYTFERNTAADILSPYELVSSAAIGAIMAAINGRPGIRFEMLSDADDPRPAVAVLFANAISMEHFDGLIEATLALSGVKVSVAHAPPTPAPAAQDATREVVSPERKVRHRATTFRAA